MKPENKLATATVAAPSFAATDPLVDTAHMQEPHARASAPNATTETPEYVSILASLSRSPIGQIETIAAKHKIERAEVNGTLETWDDKLPAIAEAECKELGWEKLQADESN